MASFEAPAVPPGIAQELADGIEESTAMTGESKARFQHAVITSFAIRYAVIFLAAAMTNPHLKLALRKDIHRKGPRKNPQNASKKELVRQRYRDRCEKAGKRLTLGATAPLIHEELVREGVSIGPDTVRNYLKTVEYKGE